MALVKTHTQQTKRLLFFLAVVLLLAVNVSCTVVQCGAGVDSRRFSAIRRARKKQEQESKREIRTMEAVDGPSARRGVSGGGVCV